MCQAALGAGWVRRKGIVLLVARSLSSLMAPPARSAAGDMAAGPGVGATAARRGERRRGRRRVARLGARRRRFARRGRRGTSAGKPPGAGGVQASDPTWPARRAGCAAERCPDVAPGRPRPRDDRRAAVDQRRAARSSRGGRPAALSRCRARDDPIGARSDRSAWRAGAVAIEDFRRRWSIDDPEHAVGDRDAALASPSALRRRRRRGSRSARRSGRSRGSPSAGRRRSRGPCWRRGAGCTTRRRNRVRRTQRAQRSAERPSVRPTSSTFAAGNRSEGCRVRARPAVQDRFAPGPARVPRRHPHESGLGALDAEYASRSPRAMASTGRTALFSRRHGSGRRASQ